MSRYDYGTEYAYDWYSNEDRDRDAAEHDAWIDERERERAEARAAIADDEDRDPEDISDDECDALIAEWAATEETQRGLMPGRI